ncbi:MAG TPA: TolC family protein, partial [Pseudomonadota bacterium]|nr:TolC family protein [Pseudomonadota bacterium]
KKLRNQTKSATIRYLATREGRHLAITNLVAEIASSYYELQALYATLDVVKQNIAIQQNALTVVRLQKEAARVTELAVKRFEAEVLKNQSRQYAIAQQMVETENRINFLLGRFPQPIDLQRDHFADQLPPILHAGIPAQLLENRPDVKQAWLEILAANLDVKVAKASFYPALGINATLGLQSFDPLKLVSFPASLVYGLAADLMVPLINRKAITANYFSANSRELQAVYHYERAILSGFVEVSKLLSMVYNLEQSYNLKTQEVEKLTQSIDISGRLFSSARADYMEVLLTRRDALEAQLELIENKKRQLLAAVSLYRALGGGWR